MKDLLNRINLAYLVQWSFDFQQLPNRRRCRIMLGRPLQKLSGYSYDVYFEIEVVEAF